MMTLKLNFANFQDYMTQRLSPATRKDLRRKFRDSGELEMSMTTDVGPIVDEIYPLYLNVYERASHRFEKLTKAFFRELGRRMPDKTACFVWRRNGRIVAFNLCLLQDKTICAEYIGLDYDVAHELSLYFVAFRDVVTWAIEHGYDTYASTCGTYETKRHLRLMLSPLDLYVRHTNAAFNMVLALFLPLLSPTRYESVLRTFAEFPTLFG